MYVPVDNITESEIHLSGWRGKSEELDKSPAFILPTLSINIFCRATAAAACQRLALAVLVSGLLL